MFDRDLRRALRFIVPYWRRLALVLALSFASTALSLYLPLLSRDFFDGALVGKDVATLTRVLFLAGTVAMLAWLDLRLFLATVMLSFIDTLPQRYQTIVGERGMALSAGERQRIALARAFLAEPDVLVLDEPTSALDPETERQVIDGYKAVMRGRTTIVITHRLDVARRADRTITIAGARVAEPAC